MSPFTVKLNLRQKYQIHNVFDVSLVEPYRTGNIRTTPNPAKVLQEIDDIENSEEYNVDEIMGSSKEGRHIL